MVNSNKLCKSPYGGGGLYIGFVSLLLSYMGLMTMKQTNEGKDNKKLFCNLTV